MQGASRTSYSSVKPDANATRKRKDHRILICIAASLTVYIIFCFYYTTSGISIVSPVIPYSVGHRITLKNNFNSEEFTQLISKHQLKQQYLQWLNKPNSFCWNPQNLMNKNVERGVESTTHQTQNAVIVVSVMYNYDNNDNKQSSFMKLIRNNRMMYVLKQYLKKSNTNINNYNGNSNTIVYCELSNTFINSNVNDNNNNEETNYLKLLLKNGLNYINKVDYDEYYRILWYKMVFIQFLMQYPQLYMVEFNTDAYVDNINQTQIKSDSYFLLVDADAVFINFDRSIIDIIDDYSDKDASNRKFDILFATDGGGINNAVSIYHKSDWIEQVFFKFIFDKNVIKQTLNDPTREERAIKIFIKHTQRKFNSKMFKDYNNQLQIFNYQDLDEYGLFLEDEELPLTFHFYKSEEQNEQKNHIIECIVILSRLQPIWMLNETFYATFGKVTHNKDTQRLFDYYCLQSRRWQHSIWF